MDSPPRPLGLSLAIALSVILYTVMPIVSVIFYVSLQLHFNGIDFLENGGAIGTSFTGPGAALLLLHLVYAVIFMVVAIFAWRGKPARIRWIFVGAVIVITVISILIDLGSMHSATSAAQGIDSAQDLSSTVLTSRIVGSTLVALYVVWYVNRAPARAFYRGQVHPVQDHYA